MHLPNTCGLGLTVTTGLFADAPMVGCLLGGVPVVWYDPASVARGAAIRLPAPVALGRSRNPADTADPVVERFFILLNVHKWTRLRYVPKPIVRDVF